MPKANSIRQRPRAAPYTKRKPSKRAKIKLPKPEPVQQNSRFLALPLEVRLQIYSYFALIPPCAYLSHFPLEQNEHHLAKKARKNLLMVCRQVAKEWSPIFYRSTTIVVNTMRPEALRVWNEREQIFHYIGEEGSADFYRAREFGEVFLKNLNHYKLQSIRKLRYDATLWSCGGRYNHMLDCETLLEHTAVDFAGLKCLGEILFKNSGILRSLGEVVISGTLELEREGFDLEFENNAWFRLPDIRKPNYSNKIWLAASMNSGGRWDEVVRTLQSRSRSGVLKGWEVTKMVRIQVHRCCRRFMPEEVQIAFVKRNIAQGSVSDTNTSATVQILHEDACEFMF